MTDQPLEGSHAARSTVGGSPFPPIADYGFLSDCEVSALVAPSGNVEWMWLPRMDGPSVFATILDRGAGWFRLGPADAVVPSGRRYLAGTMVLETTWGCEPAFDYGCQRGTWRYRGSGYGQAEVSAGEGSPLLRLTTDLNVGFEGPRAIARRRLRAGERVFCALSWGDGNPPETFDDAHQRLARTADFWHEWLARGDFPDHPWRRYLQRSALTLKGLIYALTGALLAAATSSLPETPGGERNYDYRYTWLRDATFMLWGLYTLGLDREANDFWCCGTGSRKPTTASAARRGRSRSARSGWCPR